MINTKRIVPKILSFILVATVLSAISSSAVANNSTFECGRNLYRSKMYKAALRYFKAAETVAGYDSRSYYYEALCYHQMGQLQSAMVAYKKVINKFPRSNAAEQSQKGLASIAKSLSSLKSDKSVGGLTGLRMDQIPLVTTVSAIEVDGKPVVEALVSGSKVKFVVDSSVPDTIIGVNVPAASKLTDVATHDKSDKDSSYFLHEIKLGNMYRAGFPVKILKPLYWVLTSLPIQIKPLTPEQGCLQLEERLVSVILLKSVSSISIKGVIEKLIHF